jgi:DNA repair protein RadC
MAIRRTQRERTGLMGDNMESNGVGHYQPMIRDLPQGERPRERLKEYGPSHLSNTELIAILLRTGVTGENVLAMSSRLLAGANGLAGLGKRTFS